MVEKISKYLLRHTWWVFLAGILFCSMSIALNLNEQNWSTYLGIAAKLSLYYSPILVFSLYREQIEKKLRLPYLLPLWIFVFVALPALQNNMEVYDLLDIPEYNEILAIMSGSILFMCEVAFQISRLQKHSSFNKDWFSGLKLENSIFIFLIVFAIFYILIGRSSPENGIRGTSIFYHIYLIFQVFLMLLIYYCFYWINHYILVMKIWKERGLIWYLFGFGATIMFLYPIASQLIYWLPIVQETEIHPVNNGQLFEDVNWLLPLAGMTLSIPFIMTVRWFRQSKVLEEMAKEKSETELSLLKQQINPHFFFNTLNNLYALSITKDNQTPEVILQLSELMRYTIYKGKEEKVRLEEEIKYIEDYIQLQLIRLHKKLDFRFDKEIEDGRLLVPPLIFINLVENAFKHGIEPAENDCFLHLNITSKGNELCFTCKNSVEEQTEKIEGTGLTNLKRRLELRFPEQHSLNLIPNKTAYTAELKLLNLSK